MTRTQQILDECVGLAGVAFREKGLACSAREAALYLAHTGRGQSIRALAEVVGTHPSTVMRTIRRIEERRDDPLVDRLLDELELAGGEPPGGPARDRPKPPMAEEEVAREARRYLRRLAEPGSFLLVGNGADKAGVFTAANAHRRPIAMLAVGLAAEFLRRDWIRVDQRGTASMRYRLTDVGRAFLRRAIAEEQVRRRGAETGRTGAPGPFQRQHALEGTRAIVDGQGGERVEHRVNLGESPLGWLARRRGPKGEAFLTPVEVEAGERLRSDFERAQMGPSVAQDWRKFLTPGDRLSGTPVPGSPCTGPAEARERVTRALALLGPGLADIAFRVCCFLEGLETCEKRMGWSARSGKVVLKLALGRLAEHYGLSPRH